MSLRPVLRLLPSRSLRSSSPSTSSILHISLLVRPSVHSSRSGISDITSSHIHLNVSAPAIDGRANAAVVEMIANVLSVAKTDVRVVKGEKGREKVVEVAMRSGKDGDGEGVLQGVRKRLEGAVVGKGR